MKSHVNGRLKDGSKCKVVDGTHAGKSGIVRDVKTSKTGHHNGRASDWRTIQNSSKKCSDKGLGNLFIAVLKLVAVQVAADKCREIRFHHLSQIEIGSDNPC